MVENPSSRETNDKFNPELERTKSITHQLSKRLSQLEDRMQRDMQGAVSISSDRLQQLEARLHGHERHTITQLDDVKTKSFQAATELAGKVNQIDRQRSEDHQRQIYLGEESARLKDGIQTLSTRHADIAGRLERVNKDIMQNTSRAQELLHIVKDHDLQLGKLGSHLSTEMDTMSKRVSLMNTDLSEKLQFEAKTRAAQDIKYDQLLKDLRTYVARHLDDSNAKIDNCKLLIHDNYNKSKSDILNASQEVKTIIQHLEKSIRDQEVFVKDQVLRQILSVAETVKLNKEEALKGVQDLNHNLNQTLARHRQEDIDRLQSKEGQLEAYKESINATLRQIQDHGRHEEIEINRKIGYVEELIREEANTRVISEQNVNRLVQESRNMLVSSVEDVDQKIRSTVQDLTQNIEKTSNKIHTDLLNRVQLEKRRVDEIENVFLSYKKGQKDRMDEVDSRIKVNAALLERMDQDVRHHHSYFETTLKENKVMLETAQRSSDSRLDDLNSSLNSFKVDIIQQLEQKVIHFESVSQVQQEELDKCIRKSEMERLEQQLAVNIEESTNTVERNRRLLVDEVQSKLQSQEDQLIRRIGNVDQQQQILKESLEMQQTTFSQFHQMVLNALNKNQTEIGQRAHRDDMERQYARLENLFRNLQSEVSLLNKQMDIVNTSKGYNLGRTAAASIPVSKDIAPASSGFSTSYGIAEPKVTSTYSRIYDKRGGTAQPDDQSGVELDADSNEFIEKSVVKRGSVSKRATTAKPKSESKKSSPKSSQEDYNYGKDDENIDAESEGLVETETVQIESTKPKTVVFSPVVSRKAINNSDTSLAQSSATKDIVSPKLRKSTTDAKLPVVGGQIVDGTLTPKTKSSQPKVSSATTSQNIKKATPSGSAKNVNASSGAVATTSAPRSLATSRSQSPSIQKKPSSNTEIVRATSASSVTNIIAQDENVQEIADSTYHLEQDNEIENQIAGSSEQNPTDQQP